MKIRRAVKGQGHRVTLRISTRKRCNSNTEKSSKFKLGESYLRAERDSLHDVQGHKVKYFNRNNSAADCSIAFKLIGTIVEALPTTEPPEYI